jgi:hypothetical protein
MGDRRAAGVVSLDFGLMDFVSAHHGAIPLGAMVSPAQFEHPLVVRAKCEIAAAALAHGIVPAHNVTRALDNPDRVFDDARRARDHFGYLRMWSIHPGQIDPIVDAMRPAVPEVEKAQRSSTRRRTPTGDRFASTASSTTARRIARPGPRCNARAPRASARRARRRLFRNRMRSPLKISAAIACIALRRRRARAGLPQAQVRPLGAHHHHQQGQ